MRFGFRSNNSIKDGEEGKWLPFMRTVKLVSLLGSVACESVDWNQKSYRASLAGFLN